MPSTTDVVKRLTRRTWLRIVVVRPTRVDQMLDQGGPSHRQRNKDETESDTSDQAKLNVMLSQRWIDEFFEDGYEENQNDGIDIR